LGDVIHQLAEGGQRHMAANGFIPGAAQANLAIQIAGGGHFYVNFGEIVGGGHWHGSLSVGWVREVMNNE
jgi:hypothetical protein